MYNSVSVFSSVSGLIVIRVCESMILDLIW